MDRTGSLRWHVVCAGSAAPSGSTGREFTVTSTGGPDDGGRMLASLALIVQDVSHPHFPGAGSLPGSLRPIRVARKVSTITIRP
jgi:hypothetical protein